LAVSSLSSRSSCRSALAVEVPAPLAGGASRAGLPARPGSASATPSMRTAQKPRIEAGPTPLHAASSTKQARRSRWADSRKDEEKALSKEDRAGGAQSLNREVPPRRASSAGP